MVRLRSQEDDYTFISERVLTGSGFATSPELISGIVDLQRRTIDQTADAADISAATDAAQGAADSAGAAASGAQASADAAQSSADGAQARADAAYTRADDAYALADTKVTQDVGPSFAAPLGAVSRTALPAYTPGAAAAAYTQADVQALQDQVVILTRTLAAVITDLRGNGALKE